jgi:hypothetical protein
LGKELLVKNHDGYVKALGKWFFRFFNYNVPTAQFTSFKQCIDAQLGAHFDLTQIIKSGSLSKLKGCYRKIQKSSNFNDTSLMVYHAPIKPSSRKGIVQFDCPVPYCNFLKLATPLVCTFSFAVNYSSVPGQFLTGDINLNTNLTEIEKHYQPFFPEVSVVQVPHHGAWRNWNKGILRNFHDNIIFVASAGTRNRFNHPDPNVVSDIQKSHDFLWCNELAGIHIYYV